MGVLDFFIVEGRVLGFFLSPLKILNFNVQFTGETANLMLDTRSSCGLTFQSVAHLLVKLINTE